MTLKPIDLFALPPMPLCLRDRALWTGSAAWHQHHARVADAIRTLDPACPECEVHPRAEKAMNLQFAYAEDADADDACAAAWGIVLPVGRVVTFDVPDALVPYVLAVAFDEAVPCRPDRRC